MYLSGRCWLRRNSRSRVDSREHRYSSSSSSKTTTAAAVATTTTTHSPTFSESTLLLLLLLRFSSRIPSALVYCWCSSTTETTTTEATLSSRYDFVTVKKRLKNNNLWGCDKNEDFHFGKKPTEKNTSSSSGKEDDECLINKKNARLNTAEEVPFNKSLCQTLTFSFDWRFSSVPNAWRLPVSRFSPSFSSLERSPRLSIPRRFG